MTNVAACASLSAQFKFPWGSFISSWQKVVVLLCMYKSFFKSKYRTVCLVSELADLLFLGFVGFFLQQVSENWNRP